MDFPRWRIRLWTFHSSIARRGLPARSTPDHTRASGDCRVPALLSATTEQAAERRQLDLFLDGRDAFLVHEIVTSLALRDRSRAETGLGRLRDEHPLHPDLPALALLVAALHSPPVSPITHATITSDIEAVRQSLAPAAYRLLGKTARSCSSRRGRRWERQRRTSRSTKPIRMLTAVGSANSTATGPPAFGEASLDEFADTTHAAGWFPLLRHRGLVHLFQADEVLAAGIAARVFRHLLLLLRLESQGLSDLLVRERQALQQLSPGFFRYYMDAVGQRRLRLWLRVPDAAAGHRQASPVAARGVRTALYARNPA